MNPFDRLPRRILAIGPACILAWLTAIASGDDFADLARRHAPEAYVTQKVHQWVAVFTVGEGMNRAYVFVPQGPSPVDAPLVFLHHGWLGMNPRNFGALIDLLTRRGAAVVYPVYQDGDRTAPQAVTALAARADAAALRAINQRFPGLVDTKKTFYFGYSMGAAIALNLALDPARYGLPAPRALMLVAPGDAHHVARGAKAASIYGKVQTLSEDLPTVLVTGAADTSIGVPTAKALAKRLCPSRRARRVLIVLPSDSDGDSRIQAGHGSPGAPDSRYNFPDPYAAIPSSIPPRDGIESSVSLNLLDYYGYWRIATRLLDYVGGKEFPSELFSDNPENRFLGLWPSGRAYTNAQIEEPCVGRTAYRF